MWRCYILYSDTQNITYCGVTSNIDRRIKQHNGELKGGAKATRRGRPWKILAIVDNFNVNNDAYSFEYQLKHINRYSNLDPKSRKMRIINDLIYSDDWRDHNLNLIQYYSDL